MHPPSSSAKRPSGDSGETVLGGRPLTLITGATGFAGGHLAEALLARGDRVVGISRRGQWPSVWSHLVHRVELYSCDLTNAQSLEALLRQLNPARIIHAAGSPQVAQSFRDPDAAWEGNLTTTRRLYEAVEKWGGNPRILYIGSGLIYGNGDSDRPLDETLLLRPTSPYASSKAAADLLSYQISKTSGLEIIRARPFNHIGPRQSPDFAVPHFARQLIAIERGLQPAVLETGVLSTYRDLTDVRDTIAAYLLLLEQGQPGEAYNIACGHSVSMQQVVDRLVALAGHQVEVRQRAELVRPGEQSIVRVDVSKLHRTTRWVPGYSLDQTLADTLDFWRSQPAPV